MKQAVIEIYRQLGAPPPPKPEPDIDEVYKYIEQGLDLKDIAKIYGIEPTKFCEFTRAHGINGYLLQNGEMSKRYTRRRKENGTK